MTTAMATPVKSKVDELLLSAGTDARLQHFGVFAALEYIFHS
jgi:hypothetical protein